jgi:hypothetical protein
MVSLKFKAKVHIRRRPPRQRHMEKPAMSEPKKITVLGVVTRDEPDEALAFSFPPGADAATITSMLEAAERERIEKRAAESRELRRLFLEKLAIEK